MAASEGGHGVAGEADCLHDASFIARVNVCLGPGLRRDDERACAAVLTAWIPSGLALSFTSWPRRRPSTTIRNRYCVGDEVRPRHFSIVPPAERCLVLGLRGDDVRTSGNHNLVISPHRHPRAGGDPSRSIEVTALGSILLHRQIRMLSLLSGDRTSFAIPGSFAREPVFPFTPPAFQ